MSPLVKFLILMTSVQYVKLEDEKTSSSDNVETLPQPSALAAPERSSLDEEQYNMAASWLKHQFSLPQHVVPSYQDTRVSPRQSQQYDVNLANHRPFHQTGFFERRKTHDDPNFLSNVIYENYDESGEFFDYEYDDSWHHKPQSEDIWKNVENERKFPKKSFENKNHNFNTRNDHSRQAQKYRRLEGGKSPTTSLYRDILQSKIRGQPTSTFKGDWVKPHQTRTQKHKRKSPYPGSKNVYNQRRRKAPPTGLPLRTGGQTNILSAFVKQVTDSISTVFSGTKRRRAFPRIQYGPLHFGPPLKKLPPRHAPYNLDYYYDYQGYGDTARIDNYDYLYYEDYYEQYNPQPARGSSKHGKSNRKKHTKQRQNLVGDTIVKTIKEEDVSPSSGEITVTEGPQPPAEEISRERQRIYRERSKYNNSKDYDTDSGYVKSDEEPEYESTSYNDVDYNDIFDDVIDTTVNPMVAIENLAGDVTWGEDMWAEISRDFKRESQRPRQKVKMRRQRKPGGSSTRGTAGTRGTARPPTALEEANQLSIWAAAERVSEDAPSIRFDDGPTDFYEKINKAMTRKPTTATPDVKREFFEGFQPSKKDNSGRMNNFMSQTYHDSQQSENLSNHQTAGSSLYDQKMIIDFPPPPSPASLPVMSMQTPFSLQSFTRSPVRTRTLQELTLGSH